MFVVLEHNTTQATGVPPAERGRHWDLLIELPGRERLPTWRLACNPLDTTAAIPAERLPDHRRLYLDYEGELTRNRGAVRRVDRGPATIERFEDDCVVVVLNGDRLQGRFEIVSHEGGHAVFRRTPP
jgi:hypothetical protein